METTPAAALLEWFASHSRELPWRGPMPRDPYTVLLSEVMAQQTQIDRVVPAYQRLLACFPTVEALAAASEDAVVAAFSGLGYYRRARLLHQTAQAVVAAGGWPAGEAELRKLPGIGTYTAAALSAFAFSGTTPPVDGNVMRIAARSLALALPLGSPALARAAGAWLAALHAAEPTPFIFEAAMGLGASVCTPATPSCPVCPLRPSCRAAGEGRPERFPAPRPVRATESHTWVVLWARRDRGEVLLRRVDKGPLLAGLWLPPFRPRDGNERAAAVATELAAAHGLPGVPRRVPHAVRHGITHRAITVEVFVLEAPPQAAESVDGTAWRNPALTRAADILAARQDRARRLPGGIMTRPVTPVLTVDAVIVDPERGVVLIRRGHEPFAGCWALPGGFVEVGETCEAACVREVREETGLDVEISALLGVFSDPGRDPRGHTVATVYLCRAVGGILRGGDDASDARYFTALGNLTLAFDHDRVLAAAGYRPARHGLESPSA